MFYHRLTKIKGKSLLHFQPLFIRPQGIDPAQFFYIHINHAIRMVEALFYLFIMVAIQATHGRLMHFLHVLAGVGFLLPTAWRAAQGAYGPDNSSTVEAVAVFWHLVDLIWIFLFPLIYLAR